MNFLLRLWTSLIKNVEADFLAVEDALEQVLKDIRSELSDIKKRLDRANL